MPHPPTTNAPLLPPLDLQPQWEKVLWRPQPFADNYVPPSFLSELASLRKSLYPPQPISTSLYWRTDCCWLIPRPAPRPRPRPGALFLAALPVSQHLAVIALFIAIFGNLLDGSFEAGQVGWGCVALALVGYGIRRWIWPPKPAETGNHNVFIELIPGLLPPPTPLRPLILPPLLLSLLSPVLGTLTSATTSDSIWPLAGGLLFLHILLADFSTGKLARKRNRRRGSISQEEPLDEKRYADGLYTRWTDCTHAES